MSEMGRHARETSRDCLKRCPGWGPLKGIGRWGDRATAQFDCIEKPKFRGSGFRRPLSCGCYRRQIGATIEPIERETRDGR